MMHYLLASDKAFLPHTATTIASILVWNPGSTIHWIRSEFSGQIDQKLRKFVSRLGGNLFLYEAKEEYFANLHVDKHASSANYFRLQAPMLLPESVEYVLYLDSDVLVRRPLDALWAVELGDHMLAACQDQGAELFASELGLEADSYFNSGVMLIPLRRWRKQKVVEELFSYIHRNNGQMRYWDQDALNAVVRGRWLPLSYTYNAQHLLYLDERKRVGYQDILKNPHIVHFSGGGAKPWQSKLTHPLKDEYRRYRAMTPWPRFKEEGPRTSSRGQKLRRRLTRVWDDCLPGSGIGRRLQSLIRKTRVHKAIHKKRSINRALLEQHRRGLRQEQNCRQQELAAQLSQVCFRGDRRVRTGPFAGLHCMNRATCSQVLPKIAGTYEQPIHRVVNRWVRNQPFTRVVNIGCADGYYAIGFATCFPGCSIFAFDRSEVAREQCAEMARLNGVDGQVRVHGDCDHRKLSDICGAGTLVFCDIEGGEVELLDPVQIRGLKHSEILVEAHDFLHPNATDCLIERFRLTHSIRVIVDYPRDAAELAEVLHGEGTEVSADELGKIVDEARPAGMRWLHMIPIGINGG